MIKEKDYPEEARKKQTEKTTGVCFKCNLPLSWNGVSYSCSHCKPNRTKEDVGDN